MAEKKQIEWVPIGKLGSTHKLNGAIKLHLNDGIGLKKLNNILCGKTQQAALPYSIKDIKPFSTDSFIVELEDITTREKAQQITGSTVWCNKKFVVLDEQIINAEMKGYLLIDVQNGELGKIDEIYFMPAQTLLEFKFQGNEIMLPCHEETIVKINHTKKEVLVNMPEGLLDVYLKK